MSEKWRYHESVRGRNSIYYVEIYERPHQVIGYEYRLDPSTGLRRYARQSTEYRDTSIAARLKARQMLGGN